jgi:hypothetical protein
MSGKIKELNGKIEKLTIEMVKAIPEYKDFSDEQAQEVIQSLERFTAITFELFNKCETENCELKEAA